MFEELGALDRLEHFLSINGPAFFGIEPSREMITLVKGDWRLTEPVVNDEGTRIWPLGNTQTGFNDEVVRWQIA